MDAGSFAELFGGRENIWLDCSKDIRGTGPVTDDLWEAHLFGEQPIGIYNLMPDSTVRWSATDIDVDRPDWVDRLAKVWSAYGVKAWAERSRSKGWHLWIFHPAPIPAETARNAWLWVHEVADVPATEVYPKQTDGSDNNGNCIRLPLHAGREPGRQTFYYANLEDELDPDHFILSALDARSTATEAKMADIARNYAIEEFAPSGGTAHLARRNNGGMDQAIAKVYSGEARVNEGERDNTFWTLACFCIARGHTEAETENIITSVYYKQTDQNGYPLTQALKKVPRAFRQVERKMAKYGQHKPRLQRAEAS